MLTMIRPMLPKDFSLCPPQFRDTGSKLSCFDRENLARMLRHRNIKTTQIYGKIHEKNVFDEVDRMKSAMKGNFIAPKKPKADRKG